MDSFLEGISSSVQIKTIQEATKEAVDTLRGDLPTFYLKTGIEKLDKTLFGGVEEGSLVTIGGISGSGKSALANLIETNIAENYKKVVVLNFSFEMKGKAQVLRKLSSKLLTPVQRLRDMIQVTYDPAQDKPENGCADNSSKSQLDLAGEKDAAMAEIARESVYYVEEAISVREICDIVESFQKKCIEEGKWLVVFLDHALLINGKSADERTNVADLEKALIKLKKRGKTTIFQLMQLNRNIESSERRTNRLMHYPSRSDLSTADAVYQASDMVWIIHRPELLNIKSYGPGEIDCRGKVFLHVIKFRDGEPKILMFDNHLDVNRMELPEPA